MGKRNRIIKGSIDISDIKRCYIDATYTINCPTCDKKIDWNFNDNYLSYLEVDVKKDWGFYCSDCDLDIEATITLKSAIATLEIE